MPGPTCPVSPSVARSPHIIRSKRPIFSIALANTYEVAKVSAPANLLSDSKIPSSHHIAIASFIASIAFSVPMDMTIISPLYLSFSLIAVSMAYKSRGFTILSTPSLTIVPVTGIHSHIARLRYLFYWDYYSHRFFSSF